MRVTFTPYTLEKCILPKVLPFMRGLVTTMRRDTIGCCCSFSSFHSLSSSGPMKALMGSASASAHTISNSSLISKIVLRLGMPT